MTVNGLPLHPLVVHATVVALPAAALLALAYCIPRWRDRLRWPLLAAGVVAAVLVWVANRTGHSLKSARFATATGELASRIAHHQSLANRLQLVTFLFAVICVVAVLLHARRGSLRAGLAALLAAGAIAVTVLCVLTGDAGAQAVWGQYTPVR